MLARWLGGEHLLLLLRDEEVKAFLPAPGFPQTLIPSKQWEPLLSASAQTPLRSDVVSPFSGARTRVFAASTVADLRLVLLGGEPDASRFEAFSGYLPLILHLLSTERALAAAEGATLAFREASARTATLVRTLDETNARLERALSDREQALEQLHASLRARDDFLSLASHELRTPLTSLLLQLSMRERQLAVGRADLFQPSRLPKIFRHDKRQLERLSRLVNEMLDISRIESGRLELRVERFDLGELAEETLERHGTQLSAAGCDVKLHRSGPVVGQWDRFRVEQVLTNLLTNAMKYAPRTALHVAVEQDGQIARLIVRDHGKGIDPRDQERIFDRFERAVSTSDDVGGLGLGLYIVKQIVGLHGGSIEVRSAPGEGATFTVTLPRDETAVEDDAQSPRVAGNDKGAARPS